MDNAGGGLWTEAVLLIAVVECGSMNRAADRLGVPQHTISRRVKRLEDQLGYPLFQRLPSGVAPTPVCLELLPAAQAVADAARDFARAAGKLGRPSPVTLSAPEGLAAYFLAPALAVAGAMPPLQLVHGGDADIEILLVELGQPVCRPAAMCVKRVGRMPFVAVAGKGYLATAGEPRTIRDLAAGRRLTHMIYDVHPAFAEWTDAVRTPDEGPALTVATSSALHRAAAAGGIALLPRFAPQLDGEMVAVDCGLPEIAVDVYMAAHPDLLRLPSVRQVFDGVGALFTASPWFS